MCEKFFRWDALQHVRIKMRQQLTMALEPNGSLTTSDDIFPLPVSQSDPVEISSTISGLNDLSGCNTSDKAPSPGDFLVDVKKRLGELVSRFKIWQTPKPEVDFSRLFQRKDVDYLGEEVKVAQNLSWEAVRESLPEGVGRLPLQDFCWHGTLEYILNFEKYLMPMDMIKVPRPLRLWRRMDLGMSYVKDW